MENGLVKYDYMCISQNIAYKVRGIIRAHNKTPNMYRIENSTINQINNIIKYIIIHIGVWRPFKNRDKPFNPICALQFLHRATWPSALLANRPITICRYSQPSLTQFGMRITPHSMKTSIAALLLFRKLRMSLLDSYKPMGLAARSASGRRSMRAPGASSSKTASS